MSGVPEPQRAHARHCVEMGLAMINTIRSVAPTLEFLRVCQGKQEGAVLFSSFNKRNSMFLNRPQECEEAAEVRHGHEDRDPLWLRPVWCSGAAEMAV